LGRSRRYWDFAMPMKSGVQKIAPDLYQSSWDDAVKWHDMSNYVDIAVVMCGGKLPQSITQIEFPIDDNANGCDCFSAVQELAKSVSTQRVLSVCHMGENRSGLLSTLILISRGESPAQAVALVQTNGPHNSPTQAHSFWNPGFVKQVLWLS
jgi:hypothetical protein